MLSSSSSWGCRIQQLYLIYNQTTNYSALIKTVGLQCCSVSQLCNSAKVVLALFWPNTTVYHSCVPPAGRDF